MDMETVASQVVEPECLPFSSIPHTSRLFDDFLHHFDKVRKFYARPPQPGSWSGEERERIVYPDDRRKTVTEILERQNRELGAGAKTMQNIQRLRNGAVAVVTGQQVGLFGGPLFCVLKAISAVRLAEQTGAVPVFWLAGEDHDLAEVNFVNLPAGDRLEKLAVEAPHHEGAPVGAIAFDDQVAAAVKQVEAHFAASQVSEVLEASYRKGETFLSAFAKFYAQLLPDMGIVFLNPLDAELHRVAQPLYRSALEESEVINQALLKREQELESAGYHVQVKVTPSHTLCFYLEDGTRLPVRHAGGRFLIGERSLSRDELVGEVARCPERFSANVLLRPVIQDYLLPTLCYIGGPAEVAYFAQAESVYRHLAARVTPIVPRIFATLIEPRQAKLLKRYELKLADVFVPPEKLGELVAARALPNGVMRSFDAAARHLDQALAAIQPSLETLDRTLVDAAENAASKMRHQLQSLRDKAARAEARKNTELLRHAAELSTLLYPNKELQEREIAAVYFLQKYGVGLVETLKQSLKAGCLDHQVVQVGSAHLGQS
jgi:bacillithiol biosynthesis cysteine-adding enzyme BshC